MKKLLNALLTIPGLSMLNGYKTFLGFAIDQAAVLVPPQYQAIAKGIGQILFAVGLAHKGVKENL